MIIDSQKVQNLVKSAAFNTVSCLFNNLIYLVIIHYLSLNQHNASLQQNGISLALCVLTIGFDPIIFAFANGIKILYSQYYASENKNSNTHMNLLLHQSIAFSTIVGLCIMAFLFLFFDTFFTFLNYEQSVIDISKIGLVYIFISKLVFINYEFPRAQLLGLKVFGPFAYIQTSSFVLTTICCELYLYFSEVGVHQAGQLFIIHDVIKVVILFIYNSRSLKSDSALIGQHTTQTVESSIYSSFIDYAHLMIKEKIKLQELIEYVKPLSVIVLMEVIFFNASIIFSGQYSQQYIVAAVCFQMTNTLLFKGIQGLAESVTSFCGTCFGAKDYEGAKEYLFYAIGILFFYESMFIIGLLIFTDYWAASFSQDSQVIDIIIIIKYLYILTIPIDGTQVLFSAYLQVLEMKSLVSKTEVFTYMIFGIPLMYVFGHAMGFKLGGIWVAIGFCNFLNLVSYLNAIRTLDYDLQYKIACSNQDMVEVKDTEDLLTTELLPITSQN